MEITLLRSKIFEFLFDIIMGLVNPLYSFKMASFISELKKITHSIFETIQNY